jgi:hypothetical protein
MKVPRQTQGLAVPTEEGEVKLHEGNGISKMR